jgi:exosortase/archaeosortase family protein
MKEKKSEFLVDKNKYFYTMLIRYIILIPFSLNSLFIFYYIFKPLTIYFSYFLFDFTHGAYLLPNNIIFVAETFSVGIIDPCVAGSAYYLLLILNLSTPDIKINKRIIMIFSSFFTLFILNIIRIYLLGILFFEDFQFFELAHKIFWYSLSIIFVICIWFSHVKIFNIEKIPFYSDIKFLYSISFFKKKCPQ